MGRISDAQLVELITRRNLDPSDPRFLGLEGLQAYLEGYLGARAASGGTGRVIDLSARVEQLIQLGYHKVTDAGKGMRAARYRKLWPKTVTQPAAYVGRFDEPLLVDWTIAPEALFKLNSARDAYFVVTMSDCQDVVSRPVHPTTGVSLTRYIAWCQTGSRNLSRTVHDVQLSLGADEIGLVTVEGLHFPGQYESVLREHAVDLPGSRFEESDVPYVYWFGHAQPGLSAHLVGRPVVFYGSASRGSEVIPVT